MNSLQISPLVSFALGTLLIINTAVAADDDWLAQANQRIEEHRKAPLQLKVVDRQGKAIKGAEIDIQMTRHAFEFGSAIKVRYINNPEEETYRQKILELFNSGTFENALKVKSWSGDFGPEMAPDATLKALHWTHSNGVKIRGHLMTGNGLRNSSAPFIKIHEEGGKPALIEAVMGSIDDKANRTKFAIDEWDVVNHPVGLQRPGREAAGVGNARPRGQVFGIEESIGWFERSRKNLPHGKLYLNESGILSSADDSPQIDKYITWIEHVHNAGLLDGIGLQSHFRTNPDILKIEARMNRMASFGLPLRITEFTANDSDEERQAQFTRDFMTLAFSTPLVVGFQFWGFWEGAIFQPPVALFREDWSEKPNGAAYRDLVFNKWWTEEAGTSNRKGEFSTSAFLGNYDITVSVNGKSTKTTFILTKDGDGCLITFD